MGWWDVSAPPVKVGGWAATPNGKRPMKDGCCCRNPLAAESKCPLEKGSRRNRVRRPKPKGRLLRPHDCRRGPEAWPAWPVLRVALEPGTQRKATKSSSTTHPGTGYRDRPVALRRVAICWGLIVMSEAFRARFSSVTSVLFRALEVD